MAPHSDPNLEDFRDRLARIEASQGQAMGLGPRSRTGRAPSGRRIRFMGPLLTILICGILLKGALLWRVGTDSYEARVEALKQGQLLDRAGALVLRPDPASRLVASGLAHLLRGT